ncbi:hypothetical protein [Baaleninema sp.]
MGDGPVKYRSTATPTQDAISPFAFPKADLKIDRQFEGSDFPQ